MQVRIIDTIQDELFTARFKDDQFALLVRRGWIFYRNLNGVDTPCMNHTRLIEVINEAAI